MKQYITFTMLALALAQTLSAATSTDGKDATSARPVTSMDSPSVVIVPVKIKGSVFESAYLATNNSRGRYGDTLFGDLDDNTRGYLMGYPPLDEKAEEGSKPAPVTAEPDESKLDEKAEEGSKPAPAAAAPIQSKPDGDAEPKNKGFLFPLGDGPFPGGSAYMRNGGVKFRF